MLNNEDIQHICEVFAGAGLTEDKTYKKLLIIQCMNKAEDDYRETMSIARQDLYKLDHPEEK